MTLAPSRWGAAMALYMISFTSRGIVIAFFAAIFPLLARNTPHSRELRKRHEKGELSVETYEEEKGIERNKISSLGMVRPQTWCRMARIVVTQSCRLRVSWAIFLRCYSTCHCCSPSATIRKLTIMLSYCELSYPPRRSSLDPDRISRYRTTGYWVLFGTWWCA